ncbi:MAG TPA: IPT/TIG domain-containing protein [Puia sp.]|nr:IPT/TIG domain-containing protein [Puia sp.]
MRKYSFQIPYMSHVLHILAAVVLFASCTKTTTIKPVFTPISPGIGAGGQVLTLQGSGLAGLQSIVFDLGNVPVAFNPDFNTDKAVIFRVPTAANVGTQHIIFSYASGYQFSVPFTVVAVPSIVAAFPGEWEAGNTVTISGNYLGTADHVSLVGSTDTATILSATATQLVIRMPASTVATAKLTIHNNAGSSTSGFALVNMDQQLKFFTEGFGPAMQDWSWDNSSVSTDFAVSGTQGLKEKFAAGGGQGLSFHWDNNIVTTSYQTLSFWVKGGSNDNTFTVAPDAISSGTGSTANFTAPAGVWTHITLPVAGFGGVTCQRFNFQISGPTGADQTLYFDNVILVKQ